MIKKALIAIFCLVVLIAPFAAAQAHSSELSDTELAAVSTNCRAIQSTLNRIHANDGVSRVNLGRNYDAIATKLMGPLSSRLALNRIDSTALVSTYASFESAAKIFSARYSDYEPELMRAIQIDCVSRPAEFYDLVASAREKRKLVAESVRTLSRLLTDYAERFDSFARQQRSGL